MSLLNYPILFCPEHGSQGHRTVCCFCSFELIPSASHSRFSPPLEATVLPPAITGEAALFFDVLHDQFQELPDVY